MLCCVNCKVNYKDNYDFEFNEYIQHSPHGCSVFTDNFEHVFYLLGNLS